MSFLAPVLFVIAAWWLGTGLVLYLQQRIVNARAPLMLALFFIATASVAAMVLTANKLTPMHAYLGFVAAVCLWGSIELSYYSGLIGGVHRRSCPANCSLGKRFRMALGASIWHELSALIIGLLVMTLLWTADNPSGLYSFLVLWLMRWSAKLNLFFGVPNFNTDWFPQRLAYAHSYIRRARITAFFPVSVLCASVVAMQMLSAALAKPPNEALSVLLPAVLLLLAILEHLFMALPIADSKLWNRIFAKDIDEASNHLDKNMIRTDIDDAIVCTPESSQHRINKALTASTGRTLSATLKKVKATTTPSVSQ